MHLLSLQSGVVGEGKEAIDLGQSPADAVILTFADTELACLAAAHDRMGPDAPSIRLANLLHLQHPMSVDLYLEKTVRHARLVIVRLLGGRSYWSYGIDRLTDLARECPIRLAVLPGDASPDAELCRLSTLDLLDVEYLRRAFAFGGLANAEKTLEFMRHLLAGTAAPPPAEPLPAAGTYRTGARRDHAALVVFYGSLMESGFTAPIDSLADELERRGLTARCLFVRGLKDRESADKIRRAIDDLSPSVILNATGFAVGGPDQQPEADPFHRAQCPVLQVVLSGMERQAWEESPRGLGIRDLAMNVVLPELDGRIMTRALSFKAETRWHVPTECRIVTYEPATDRISFTADLAANWARLGRSRPSERRVAIVLANYPNRDGRIGNGVGYDTPESTVRILRQLHSAGYSVSDVPSSGNVLLDELLSGTTNAALRDSSTIVLPLQDYCRLFEALPERVQTDVCTRWGEAGRDPFVRDGAFHLPLRCYGSAVVGIQPARGYNIDPKSSYHDPSLVPPHGYFAFYFWLRHVHRIDAVIHNGKHGNLEWLPGKAVGLSAECYPEALLGPLPQLYPFIVNDPGEGTQAKRRTSAVIVDHLTPPMTRAESYGPLRELEALLDEYYLASGLDQRRLAALRARIFDVMRASQLDRDADIEGENDEGLRRLDAYLCDLKEAQIRDGLHVLGQSPKGRQETDLLAACVRVPRGLGEAGDQSITRALSADAGLGDAFDPLLDHPGDAWDGPRPELLSRVSDDPWRTKGDTVERLELLAARLIEGSLAAPAHWSRTTDVLREIDVKIRPALRSCGEKELSSLLLGLAGRFVEPGSAGAPTRGRLDVLPTGRNFYSLDNRAVPTPTAWTLGEKSADALLVRHFQDHGRYPTGLGLSVWGTSNMRTGGDDIAQAMALIGAKPKWDTSNWRVTGFEIIPPASLGRPRVDVTLRISGFFRDAFPLQIELFDKAIRSIGLLDEPEGDNPIAASMRTESLELESRGASGSEARRISGQRIFGSKPGAYGAGLQALIDEKLWDERSDLARAYVAWGSYAYGVAEQGEHVAGIFERRLKSIEVVLHNQDNREHDLLDSDDYYQFEGGMTAAAETMSGRRPIVYHNDHSRPERPVVRTLEEEIGRVVRSRVVNPKWIAGVMRHGYKGAFEIAATVDYLFAFAATTGAAKSHHFDLAYEAYIGDARVREFIHHNNDNALREMADRFCEAVDRGLWSPRSNSAYTELSALAGKGLQ